MFDFLKKIASAIGNYFKSGKAQKDAEVALQYAVKALPIITLLGDVITGVTPTPIDDVAWAAAKAAYPKFFDGSVNTEDELKAYALQIAGTLLQKKFPQLSKTQAVLAVQAAYLAKKSDPEAVAKVEATQ